MSCRDEILDCAREVINQKGRNEFTIKDILGCMRRHGTKYSDSTIRTHIVSRLCANAPDHHAVTYPDLERTDRGAYRLRGIPLPPEPLTAPLRSTGSHGRLGATTLGSEEVADQEKMMLSNTEKGRLFQERSRRTLERAFGCEFELEVSLPIPPRKLHTFDLANNERTIVAECKAVGWTATGNIPSAKITHLREAVQYLHDLQGELIRCLIISKSCYPSQKESLGSYFVRLNRDYLGNVNVFELAEDSDELVCMHGQLRNMGQRSRTLEPLEDTPPAVTVSDLGSFRRSLFRVLDLAEGQRSRDEGPARRVSRLRSEGKIPRNIANLMQTILGFRDAAEYEDYVLTQAERATISHAWEAIREWAWGNGWQIDDSLLARR